jgi:hypothetical protein
MSSLFLFLPVLTCKSFFVPPTLKFLFLTCSHFQPVLVPSLYSVISSLVSFPACCHFQPVPVSGLFPFPTCYHLQSVLITNLYSFPPFFLSISVFLLTCSFSLTACFPFCSHIKLVLTVGCPLQPVLNCVQCHSHFRKLFYAWSRVPFSHFSFL